ncbi:MAG: hypothetical protein WDO71_23905 [Bacteroidota bacterium]
MATAIGSFACKRIIQSIINIETDVATIVGAPFIFPSHLYHVLDEQFINVPD